MADQTKQMATAAELACLFGVTAGTISRLSDDGVLIPNKDKGRKNRLYPKDDSIKRYIKYLRDKLSNRNDSKEALNEALCYKTELQNRKLEAEVSLIERNTHSTEDVRRVMNDMLGSMRARLWAFPQTASEKLVNIPNRETVSEILRQEIYELCTLLVDYSPEQFYARNSDYLEEDACEGEAETAEPESTL